MVKVVNMSIKKKFNKSDTIQSQLLSADQVAERWAISRSSAVRILERARVPALFLSGMPRGIRRFRLSDIEAIEARATSPD